MTLAARTVSVPSGFGALERSADLQTRPRACHRRSDASAGSSGPASAINSESGLPAVNRRRSADDGDGSAPSDPASRTRALCTDAQSEVPDGELVRRPGDRRWRLQGDACAVDDRIELIEVDVSRRRHRLPQRAARAERAGDDPLRYRDALPACRGGTSAAMRAPSNRASAS